MEKRRYKRYRVSGQAEFRFGGVRATGELLDIGNGGVLMRSEEIPAQQTSLAFSFAVEGYPKALQAQGRVVYTQLNTLAVMFLGKVEGLEELLRALEQKEQKN